MVGKPPARVRAADVLTFVTAQRSGGPAGRPLRLVGDGDGGLGTDRPAAVAERVRAVRASAGPWGDVDANPVRRGAADSAGTAAAASGRVAGAHTADAAADSGAGPGRRAAPGRCARGGTGPWSRRWCWASCAAARCSVCVWPTWTSQRRVFIAEGKDGHQRLIPISGQFFTSVASYLDAERPAEADSDRLFVVLKGPRRVGRTGPGTCQYATITSLDKRTRSSTSSGPTGVRSSRGVRTGSVVRRPGAVARPRSNCAHPPHRALGDVGAAARLPASSADVPKRSPTTSRSVKHRDVLVAQQDPRSTFRLQNL
jgi:hypothetical protein